MIDNLNRNWGIMQYFLQSVASAAENRGSSKFIVVACLEVGLPNALTANPATVARFLICQIEEVRST